jgi:TRAP-type mannitol/chloroaromatic compound transport system substrate-binding protein
MHMDRRSFLKTTGAVAGATALPIAAASAATELTAPALATGRHRLQLGTRYRIAQPGTSTFLTRLAESVSAMSDRRIELVAPAAATRASEADLVLGFPEGQGELAMAHDIVAGIPNGLDEPRAVAWLNFGGGARLWSDLAYESDLKVFYAGHTGASPWLWSRLPASKVDRLTGLDVETTGFGRKIAELIGGRVGFVGEATLVDGFALVADLVRGLPRTYADACVSPFHANGRLLALSMAKPAWAKLNSSDQAILEAGAAAIAPIASAELAAHGAMAQSATHRRHGTGNLIIGRELLRDLGEAAQVLLANASRTSLAAAKLIASIQGATRTVNESSLRAS